MNLITTPAQVGYTPPATSIVHQTSASMTDRAPSTPVHLTQYDTTMPVIEVALTANGQPYTVPSGAAVNVRLAKPDGTYVYNPALGVSSNGQTVYIGTTLQMTTAWGRMSAIVEVVLNEAVAGTGTFVLEITENPVPEAAIESTSEFLTIQQIAAQVQQAAMLLEQQSTNLQNLTDNLEAVQGAADNALAAEDAAEQAKQAAQQALGFRTFFDAISPDANGSLDPSRPMTTSAAQASWTVKSKGDRIKSVQVNGFAADGQSGGLRMRKVSFDTATWTQTLQNVTRFECKIDPVTGYPTTFCENLPYDTKFYGDYEHAYTNGSYVRFYISNSKIANYGSASAYLQENPVVCYYVPDDLSATTGLYIPIQAQGHEYRCQCLPITEVLDVGDNVQSNVPSGCDRKIVFDASNLDGWSQDYTEDPEKYRYAYKLTDALSANASEEYKRNAYSDAFKVLGDGRTYYLEKGFTINAEHKNLYFYDEGEPLSEWKEKLSSNPLTLFYKSVDYARNDLPVSLETHSNGNTYAHPAVDLVAVPYTDADVAAAQQLANTPSTLPYIEDADVPMLLNESDATQTTESVAPLASALPVAGTYVVSSQDGATVQVVLKAMQDGGDASALQGKDLPGIYDLLVPIGYIFEWAPVDGGPDLSTPEKVAAYFGFGTWAAFAAGKVMAGVNSSHGIGTSVGAETHAITVNEMPSHEHNYNGWAIEVSGGDSTGYYVLAKPYDQHNNFGMNTQSSGGGAAMSLMQPTTYVYIWQRIS